MSYCRDLPLLSAAEVESIIVDTIECEADDYQSFEWAPIMKALAAIQRRAFEKRPTGTACKGCVVCWPTHPDNPNREGPTPQSAEGT